MHGNEINRLLVAIVTMIGVTALAPTAEAGYKFTGTGVGNTREQAIANAIETATAAIIDTFKPAHSSKGRKFHWSRQLMAAHPQHLVGAHYKVLTERSPAGDRARRQWTVSVEVNIPTAKLQAAWEEAQALLKWIGHPTVALFIIDQIEDHRYGSTIIETNSDTAQQMRETLMASHFEVVVSDQVDVLKGVHGEFARLNHQDLKVLTEISTKQNAQISVIGMGRTLGPTSQDRTPGRQGYDWESDAKCTMLWTDDATVIATLSADGLGTDNDADRGRITSLKNVGRILAQDFMRAIFRKWSVWAFEGRTVTITVLGCTNDQADEIEDFIETLPSSDVIEIIGAQPANNTTVLRVLSKRAPRKLSRSIRKGTYDGFSLEGLVARNNTIRLKVVN